MRRVVTRDVGLGPIFAGDLETDRACGRGVGQGRTDTQCVRRYAQREIGTLDALARTGCGAGRAIATTSAAAGGE